MIYASNTPKEKCLNQNYKQATIIMLKKQNWQYALQRHAQHCC
jgi:hypothetical protein